MIDLSMAIQIQYQYKMQRVRKIEGDGNIQRSEEYQHINTTYLPYDRTVKAVNYYTRRKKQLKRNPSNEVIINLSHRNAERSDLKNHIQTLFKSNKNIDPFISNYIKEIRVDPVINDNKFTNFNQQLYSLNEDQKVKVVQERYFPLQNYYNYIYDLQLKKELSRFVDETENKAVQLIKDQKRNSNQSIKIEELDMDRQKMFPFLQEQKSILRDKKIKGYYQSRFEPKYKNERTQSIKSIKQLPPSELNNDRRESSNNLLFSVSQNKRMQLSIKKR